MQIDVDVLLLELTEYPDDGGVVPAPENGQAVVANGLIGDFLAGTRHRHAAAHGRHGQPHQPRLVRALDATLDDAMAALGRLAETLDSTPEPIGGVIAMAEASDRAAERSSVRCDDEGGPTLTDLQRMLRGYVEGA